jgi:hypothetical protein
MGWIGCSLGQNIATGYRRVGGTRMWTTYDTGGGTIHEWANSDSAYWAAFDQQVQDYGPPVAVWIQLCVNPTGATLEEARTVVDITRARAPGAYLYITGQPLYDAGHVCALAGDGGPERTDNLAKELAADDPNVHYAGTFGPLSASDVPIDACHPGVEGEDRLGTQAKGKWGQP